MASRFRRWLILLGLSFWCFGCAQAAPPPPEAILYRDWEGAMPQEVLDAFTAETGIPVIYQTYETQEAVLEEMRAGQAFDVVVLDSALVPAAVREDLLARLRIHNMPNFKNISPNFRDLVYDPQNAHSVPYSCGTVGLVYLPELAGRPVHGWADLWDPAFAGRTIIWDSQREMLAIALKSLGYSANSENPAELEAAKYRLLALRENARMVAWESAVSAPYMARGEVVLAVGHADEVMTGRQLGADIHFVVPEEGAIMWSDNWTVPANAPNPAAAEQLIDFFLRAEVSAQISSATFYWLPNDAALPLVDPEVRGNEAIFTGFESLRNAELLTHLSPQGERLYQRMWDDVLQAGD
jgi:spermidine/putrescine transport system substrate-binding protein